MYFFCMVARLTIGFVIWKLKAFGIVHTILNHKTAPDPPQITVQCSFWVIKYRVLFKWSTVQNSAIFKRFKRDILRWMLYNKCSAPKKKRWTRFYNFSSETILVYLPQSGNIFLSQKSEKKPVTFLSSEKSILYIHMYYRNPLFPRKILQQYY